MRFRSGSESSDRPFSFRSLSFPRFARIYRTQNLATIKCTTEVLAVEEEEVPANVGGDGAGGISGVEGGGAASPEPISTAGRYTGNGTDDEALPTDVNTPSGTIPTSWPSLHVSIVLLIIAVTAIELSMARLA